MKLGRRSDREILEGRERERLGWRLENEVGIKK